MCYMEHLLEEWKVELLDVKPVYSLVFIVQEMFINLDSHYSVSLSFLLYSLTCVHNH